MGEKREAKPGEKRGAHSEDTGRDTRWMWGHERDTEDTQGEHRQGHRHMTLQRQNGVTGPPNPGPPRKQRHQTARGVGAAKNSNSSQGDPQNALYTPPLRYFPAIKLLATSLIFVH